MKKKLNVEAITNELKGASAFFPDYKPQTKEDPAPPSKTEVLTEKKKESINNDSLSASKHASMISKYTDVMIEKIRKAVKQIGKEVTFVRLTPDEKARLSDVAYTYKRQGIKTSENEISRIAINNLLADFEANGQESVLAKVIAALNA